MHLLFIDTNAAVCHQWIKQLEVVKLCSFSHLLKSMPTITVHNSSIHDVLMKVNQVPAAARMGIESTYVVTPSNSLLYMGGGFDRSLLQLLLLGTGHSDYKMLERLIQRQALRHHNGYVAPNTVHPVDLVKNKEIANLLANSMAVANWNVTQLVQIPSMVVPSKIDQLSTVFDFMWRLVAHLNTTTAGSELSHLNVIVPGIGTGYGHLDSENVAKVMVYAAAIYYLDLEHLGPAQYLTRLLLVLFLLRKNYRLFENEYDLLELEALMTEKGKYYDFATQPSDVLDWDTILQLVRL